MKEKAATELNRPLHSAPPAPSPRWPRPRCLKHCRIVEQKGADRDVVCLRTSPPSYRSGNKHTSLSKPILTVACSGTETVVQSDGLMQLQRLKCPRKSRTEHNPVYRPLSLVSVWFQSGFSRSHSFVQLLHQIRPQTTATTSRSRR